MADKISIDFDLYLITDRRVIEGRDLKEVVESALKGGVKAIQLREKGCDIPDLDGRSLFELARELRELTLKYKAQLFINDRVDIVLSVGADGVHLARDSMTVKDARGLLGNEKLIGVSCHSVEEVFNAEEDGADFVTIGPVYDTPSKRKYGKSIGVDVLKELSNIKIKKFALGGVKLKNIEECIKGGADGVALISGILASKDVEKTTREYIKKIKEIKNN